MKKATAIFIWFLALMVVWNLVAACVSAPNDLALLAGLALGVAFVWLSYKTRCFTAVRLWHK